jgi:hypothetical protein
MGPSPSLGNLDYNRNIIGGQFLEMSVHFDDFKYNMVKIYTLKINENEPYVDPETGVLIT